MSDEQKAHDLVAALRFHKHPLTQQAADEIARLRSDLALLGPVTTPTAGIVCASCIEPVSPDWTYCPYCGAQERNSDTGERIRRS